jgi:molecular chaperone GrpE
LSEEEKDKYNEEAEESVAPTPEEVIASLRDQLLRVQAEMENNRKRQERELERVRTTAIEHFARDLLELLDNVRRAEQNWLALELDDSVKQGLALILSSMEQVLSRHHIKRIEARAKNFDPNIHEALFEDRESEAKAGTITQIIEEGYMLGDRLLRAARVAVAVEKEAKPPAPSFLKEEKN